MGRFIGSPRLYTDRPIRLVRFFAFSVAPCASSASHFLYAEHRQRALHVVPQRNALAFLVH